ncbi:MAG: 30S ribosomal protein S6 [Candidatus Omnitrophota bacterium]|nr:MAG: 30S ribosomal protein S6 [Candidatus Omnitrophota bacterium]HDN97740.1 30S ribosomal protein S6 [bacterium]
MIRKYELCFLLNPELGDEEVEKEADVVEKIIKDKNGEVVKRELWGRKKLAYPINKKEEAIYYLFYFKADPSSIIEIREGLKSRGNIMRHLILQRKKLPGELENAGAQSK